MKMTATLFFAFLPDQFKALWELWGVEFLVLMNILSQSLLTFYGGSRRYRYKYWFQGLVWLAYLLSFKFATIILGKLTIIPVDGDRRHTHSELLALLAPFILMQIGSPDAITAFSIEDAELGLRQILNLVIQFFIVIYILVRSWTNSLISYLYLPMFLAGIIKYGETAWALKSALDCSRSTILYFYRKGGGSGLMDKVSGLSEATPYGRDAKLIAIAYCRFFQLRPHLENWPPRDLSKSEDDKLSIDDRPEEEILRVTEAELGFMYDVLYTKAAIVYTKAGCILRIISFFSLTGTLYGFIALFKDVFVYHIGVGFIYFVLAASAILETYQILLLPLSDWAIVMMIKHLRGGVRETFLKILAPQSKRWRKWSNTVEQFNLIDFCLDGRCSRISGWRIVKYFGIDVKVRKLRNTTRISIDGEVKELIVKEMKNMEKQRKQRPFVQVGQWTVETYSGIKTDGDLIKTIFGQSFENCIITWHLATEIFYSRHCKHHITTTPEMEAVRMISNYMMFLLARRPRVLGTTTAVFLIDEALEHIKTPLKNDLRMSRMDRTRSERDRLLGSVAPIQNGYSALKDGQDLVALLENKESKYYNKRWELIWSGWIEMMCYAASNCERKYHAKHLWQGGELITLVWLLLAHNTNTHQPPLDPNSAV